MCCERGQATIEWTAVVLLVALAFATFLAVALPHVDGRSYGGAIARAIVCAVRGGCDDGRDALASAYGQGDAELVREYAPSIVYEPGEKEIPIDYRQCRTTACGDAPDDRSLDVSQTSAGVPASVFTHVVHGIPIDRLVPRRRDPVELRRRLLVDRLEWDQAQVRADGGALVRVDAWVGGPVDAVAPSLHEREAARQVHAREVGPERDVAGMAST